MMAGRGGGLGQTMIWRRKTTIGLNIRGDFLSWCVPPTGLKSTGTKSPTFSPGSWLEPRLTAIFSPGWGCGPGLKVYFAITVSYLFMLTII